jgi:hypothetical protein
LITISSLFLLDISWAECNAVLSFCLILNVAVMIIRTRIWLNKKAVIEVHCRRWLKPSKRQMIERVLVCKMVMELLITHVMIKQRHLVPSMAIRTKGNERNRLVPNR